MAAVKQYKFRSLITLDPAANENAVRGHLGRTRTCCLVQPCHGRYFPAVISPDEDLTERDALSAVLSTALTAGEAEAFFAAGQRFTVWADALIGHAVQADRLIGQGVIACAVPFPASAPDGLAEGEAAGPAGRHGLAALGVPAGHAHGQRLAV